MLCVLVFDKCITPCFFDYHSIWNISLPEKPLFLWATHRLLPPLQSPVTSALFTCLSFAFPRMSLLESYCVQPFCTGFFHLVLHSQVSLISLRGLILISFFKSLNNIPSYGHTVFLSSRCSLPWTVSPPPDTCCINKYLSSLCLPVHFLCNIFWWTGIFEERIYNFVTAFCELRNLCLP